MGADVQRFALCSTLCSMLCSIALLRTGGRKGVLFDCVCRVLYMSQSCRIEMKRGGGPSNVHIVCSYNAHYLSEQIAGATSSTCWRDGIQKHLE